MGFLGLDLPIYCGTSLVDHRREERGQEMTTINKPMSATNLILCLSGEMEIDPGLLVETIKGDSDLMRVIRSYGAGDFTYSQVLDTLGDYF
jgi:hypothetical protein